MVATYGSRGETTIGMTAAGLGEIETLAAVRDAHGSGLMCRVILRSLAERSFELSAILRKEEKLWR